MEILTYGYSDIGGRDKNEDSYTLLSDDDKVCAVIADGLGGHGFGKTASEFAVKRLAQCHKYKSIPNMAHIMSAMQDANDDIIRARSNEFQMKTTVVCLFADCRKAIWAHIGDSRLYYFYNFELEDFTLDHSVSQLAVALGEIKRKDIPRHNERNRILRVIGGDDIQPDFKEIELKKGWHSFLLCTDGFWEYLNEDEILMDLGKSSTPEEWIKNLRCRIIKRVDGKNDNNTAAAVFIRI